MAWTIRIAVALIFDGHGHVLLVRKRGTSAFMLPGGKIQPGETPQAAMVRELREEVGCCVARSERLGRFSAVAANEPGWQVEAELFNVAIDGLPEPSAEIDAMLWLNPDNPGPLVLAPLVREIVLPLARTIAARQKSLPVRQ